MLTEMTQTYRILVNGELSDRMGFAFEGMTLSRVNGNTKLTGEIRDQAELQALLMRIADLGLTLLELSADDHAR